MLKLRDKVRNVVDIPDDAPIPHHQQQQLQQQQQQQRNELSDEQKRIFDQICDGIQASLSTAATVINNMSPEILASVLQHLGKETLLQCRYVCRYWNNVIAGLVLTKRMDDFRQFSEQLELQHHPSDGGGILSLCSSSLHRRRTALMKALRRYMCIRCQLHVDDCRCTPDSSSSSAAAAHRRTVIKSIELDTFINFSPFLAIHRISSLIVNDQCALVRCIDALMQFVDADDGEKYSFRQISITSSIDNVNKRQLTALTQIFSINNIGNIKIVPRTEEESIDTSPIDCDEFLRQYLSSFRRTISFKIRSGRLRLAQKPIRKCIKKWKSQDRCCSTISLAFGTGELDSFTRPKRHYHPDGCAHQFFDVIHPNFSASPPYRIPHDLYYTSAKYRRLNWICARLIQQHRHAGLMSSQHRQYMVERRCRRMFDRPGAGCRSMSDLMPGASRHRYRISSSKSDRSCLSIKLLHYDVRLDTDDAAIAAYNRCRLAKSEAIILHRRLVEVEDCPVHRFSMANMAKLHAQIVLDACEEFD